LELISPITNRDTLKTEDGKKFFIKNMKRQTGISILIASLFMTSAGIAKENSGAGVIVKSVPSLVSDTLDISKFMRINKFYLDIIPPSSGVQFYHDGIVFLSNSKAEVNMPETHTSFGIVEAFFAACNDSTIGNHAVFSSSDSWEVPCDAMTFNSDYSVMYFTKWPGKKESEKIYQAKYQLTKNGKHDWVSDNKPLDFCSDKSVYTHPALSADGEKIVFSSNKSESYGGLDLFISYKEGNGWSSPENLGNKINTKGNELYPFLDKDDNLFFSSNGIEGFGGYDIYICRYNGNGWDKPVNLTKEINSVNDDLAFKLSKADGKSAFFTTRPKMGNKPAQLFKVTFLNQYAVNNLKNLSEVFRFITQAESAPVEKIVPVAINQAEDRDDKNPVQTQEKKATENKQPPVIPPPVKPGEKPAVKPVQSQAKPVVEQTSATAGEVIYRVQFASNMKPRGSIEITAGSKKYKTFEYLYNGAYRSCAGEFSTSAAAAGLQKIMKQEGYPDAFVVAFKNNVRSTDPALFKK
jgi:hypothetical protein